MAHEKNYRSYLLPYEEAIQRVSTLEKKVLHYTWDIYIRTINLLLEEFEEEQRKNGVHNSCFIKFIVFHPSSARTDLSH